MSRHGWTIVLALLTLASLPNTVHTLTWNSSVQLTSDSITHAQPRISLDGTKITYMGNPLPYRDWQVFAMNSSGTGVRQLTNNTGSNLVPSINGNGTLVVFYSDVDGNFEIYKVKSDGTGLSQLTSTSKVVNTYPVVSSDGSRIVFQSNRTGNMETYSMFSNGSGLTQLTLDRAVHEHASISSDGKTIVFDSNSTGNREIFLVYSNGTGLHQLTFNPGDNISPVVSGDGRYVAFQSNSTGRYEIWLIGTDGSGQRQLTFDAANDYFPSINSDGSLVTYEGSVNGLSQIMVVGTSNGQVDQLTFDQANHYSPSIDGTGAHVVYQADASGFSQLYLVTRVNHDVAITGISVSRSFAYSGVSAQPIKINVTAANQGLFSETFFVSVKANSTLIGNQTVTLAAGLSKVVIFIWHPELLARGNYTITANASRVMGETILGNNQLGSGTFTVKMRGDVNGDCKVNLLDLLRVGGSFGSLAGSPSYDPAADENNDGVVDFFDFVVIGGNFGATC